MKLFASMWHKAEWMEHPMRLELTSVGLLVKVANHYITKGALQELLFIIQTQMNNFKQCYQILII